MCRHRPVDEAVAGTRSGRLSAVDDDVGHRTSVSRLDSSTLSIQTVPRSGPGPES
jgi:hypothetical protein